MTTIAKVTRQRVPDLLVYPPGFSHATCPCKACRFPQGELVETTAAKAAVIVNGKELAPAAPAVTTLRGYGSCANAKPTDSLVVNFTLDDGRSGSVTVPAAASDADVQAAIASWSKANPLQADPLLGRTL